MVIYSEKAKLEVQTALAQELYNHLVVCNGTPHIKSILETDKYFLADLCIFIPKCPCGEFCKWEIIRDELIDFIHNNLDKKLFISPVHSPLTEEGDTRNKKAVWRLNNGYSEADARFLQSLKIT